MWPWLMVIKYTNTANLSFVLKCEEKKIIQKNIVGCRNIVKIWKKLRDKGKTNALSNKQMPKIISKIPEKINCGKIFVVFCSKTKNQENFKVKTFNTGKTLYLCQNCPKIMMKRKKKKNSYKKK